MILHPSVIALLIGSLLTTLMLLYACGHGILIITKWDLACGSELQIGLERKTYLISTIMAYAFGFQIVSFFLFIYTADRFCQLFTGAMCAVGTLSVSPFGYPALFLHLVTLLLGGVWLLVNNADNLSPTYPLIEKKYVLLLATTPVVVAETVVQALYFLSLQPNVITSCCGSLFTGSTPGMASDLAALPAIPAMAGFFGWMALTVGSGTLFLRTGKGGYVFGAVSILAVPIVVLSLISFISPYLYELPTHHCPFCVLRPESRYIGYVFYAAVVAGGIIGIGMIALLPFRSTLSMAGYLPALLRRLVLTAVILYGLLAVCVAASVVVSNLSLLRV